MQDLITAQVEIETDTALFHRHQFLYNYLIDEGIEEIVSNISDPKLAIEILIKLCATPYVPLDSLLLMLRNYNSLPLQTIANVIEEMVTESLILLNRDKASSFFKIPDDIKLMLDSYTFPLPLICKPSYLNSNTDSAYYTKQHSYSNISNLPRDVLDTIDINLDHLNQVNSTPFVLGNMTDSQISIPEQGDDSDFKYQQKLNSIAKFLDSSENIYNVLKPYSAIYLTHYYDKRGRVYCKGYQCNYQSTDVHKSVIHIQTIKEI